MIALRILLTILFSGGVFAWWEITVRLLRRRHVIEFADEPRARWRSAAELAIVFFGLYFSLTRVVTQLIATPSTSAGPIDVSLVGWLAAEQLGMSFIGIQILVMSGSSWSDLGLSLSNWRLKVWIGVCGFFAAVIPMALAIAATAKVRHDTRHPLLVLLNDSPDVSTILIIGLAAALAAPLWEEFLFRVVLQGWLSTILPPQVAIPTVACLFAFVHGMWNGVALLPLALILGYVFHRRHSYLSVVVIHALFNATMLTLQLLSPQAIE